MEKAHYIVNTSSTIGKVSHYENSLAIWLRNMLLKATPQLYQRETTGKGV
jgi:hypothetical protein